MVNSWRARTGYAYDSGLVRYMSVSSSIYYTRGSSNWSLLTPNQSTLSSLIPTVSHRPSLIPKVIEERNIPYHFENWHELSTLPEASERKHDEALDGPPPTEIVLPIKLSQPSSAHPRTEEDTTEGRKFTYWGELVDGSNFDWWYTLRVLRDCSDLVSSGWRPPPSERIGERIILSLILIAERGISYFVDKNNGKIELHEEQVRKGQLVACSCASECLVALKTLAAHEVIPQSALPSLALSLCRLLHTAESLISSCVSNCERDPIQEGATLLEKEILTQQSFVALNSTKLLAVLLASETTACSTTEVLLESMNINLSVDITENMHAEMEDCAKVASVAIRALSTAMWGKPCCITYWSSYDRLSDPRY